MALKKGISSFVILTTDGGWTFSHSLFVFHQRIHFLPTAIKGEDTRGSIIWRINAPHVSFNDPPTPTCPPYSWPDGAIRPTGDVHRDWDGDGALSAQRGHGPLCLALVPGGFDPCAAQIGQLVKLDTVLLQHRGAGWCWTWFKWAQTD